MPVTEPASGYPRVLDLAPTTQNGYRVAGGFFVVIGLGLLVFFGVAVGYQNLFASIKGVAALIGLALLIYGIALFIRGPQISATLTATEAIVRGLFWTTTIPRASISQVTNVPRITWTSADSKQRVTPVSALILNARAQSDKALAGRRNAMVADLKKWAKG